MKVRTYLHSVSPYKLHQNITRSRFSTESELIEWIYMRTHTYIHTYKHTHKYTYTNMCVYIYIYYHIYIWFIRMAWSLKTSNGCLLKESSKPNSCSVHPQRCLTWSSVYIRILKMCTVILKNEENFQWDWGMLGQKTKISFIYVLYIDCHKKVWLHRFMQDQNILILSTQQFGFKLIAYVVKLTTNSDHHTRSRYI